jgi:hypothetical protein
MRRFGLIIGFWLGLLGAGASAGTYSLTDGSHVSGQPMTYQEAGVVFKQAGDAYSPVVPWSKFTDEALTQLQADATTPREKALVEAMVVNLPANHSKLPEIVIQPVATPPRPTGHFGVFAIFTSPVGWFILLVLYAANIFAAYEVATFRNQPIQTVCGCAAIPLFGVAGTIYFLALPSVQLAEEDTRASRPQAPAAPTFATAPVYAPPPDRETAPPAPPRQSYTPAVEVVPEPEPPGLPAPIVYKRGDFSFNRRFFETKLAAFFRVVLGEAEKDMVIQIKSSRGDFIGKRISRISPTELYLQIFKEGASADEMIPFGEIMEVQIRHKDLA